MSLRVLHVISTLDPRNGGPAIAMAGLARAQQASGLNVSVFNGYAGAETPDLIDDLKRVSIVTRSVPGIARIGSGVRHLVRQLQDSVSHADVVHINALWEEVQHQAAAVARALKKPYIFTPHGMLDPWSLAQRPWRKKIYMMLRLRKDLNEAAAVHYTAAAERDLVSPLKLKSPTIIEANGIDLAEFEQLPDPTAFRRKFPQVGNRRIILFLSRIHPKKGLDLLLPAWAKVKRDNAVLVLAGPDNDGYGDAVKAMIAELNLQDDVALTGMLRGRDRIEAFAAAKVFVLPSYQENFGIVVVEALASGAPVIISDQVNIHREITAAGVGGVVPTQVEPLADMIAESLSNPEKWQSFRSRARAFALQTYDWNHIAVHWVEHYQHICDQARR